MNFYLGYYDENNVLRDVNLVYCLRNNDILKLEELIKFTTSYESEYKIIESLQIARLIPNNVNKLYYIKKDTGTNYVIINNGDQIYTKEHKDHFSYGYIKDYLVNHIEDENFRSELFGYLLRNSYAVVDVYNSFVKLNNNNRYLNEILNQLMVSNIDDELRVIIQGYLKRSKTRYEDNKSNLLSRIRNNVLNNNRNLYEYYKIVYEGKKKAPAFVENMIAIEANSKINEEINYNAAEAIVLLQNVIFTVDHHNKYVKDEQGYVFDERRLAEIGLFIANNESKKEEKGITRTLKPKNEV